ncbi:methyltransferase domain-containing protein [Actinopolymorpha pittospori]|uniref:SAM-dependent methyltransferase n=1 Tax=Actinopolymorpha pittospori TaxID=648752 RepID=A0A927MZT1_9ACTN|nr:SAM-dependent methyltransferase [Actinopolymorpha pittospori]
MNRTDFTEPRSDYVLENAAPQAERRFTALEELYDEATFANLDGTGVGPGWRCLEVGAGGGSVARWLGERVGPQGYVLATDLDPRHVDAAQSPVIEVRRHDVVHDPLPESAFDLVHARLVLVHLPERATALKQLVAALRPGGWFTMEEFDLRMAPVSTERRDAGERVLDDVTGAFVRLLELRGVDQSYGRALPRLFAEAGLVQIEAVGRVTFARGGSPGARLYRANIEQTRDQLVEAGLATAEEIERYCDRLADPEAMFTLPVLVAVRGRRP